MNKFHVTIEEIVKTKVVGSFLFDQKLWKYCDYFILNPDNSMEDKIKAYDKISEIIGENKKSTEKDVLDHIKMLRQMA